MLRGLCFRDVKRKLVRLRSFYCRDVKRKLVWLRSLYYRDVEHKLVWLRSLYCRDVEQLLVERGARGLEREALQGPELSLCLLHTLISRFAAQKNLSSVMKPLCSRHIFLSGMTFSSRHGKKHTVFAAAWNSYFILLAYAGIVGTLRLPQFYFFVCVFNTSYQLSSIFTDHNKLSTPSKFTFHFNIEICTVNLKRERRNVIFSWWQSLDLYPGWNKGDS